MSPAPGTNRLNVLRELLAEESLSTQEDLCSKLGRRGFEVTQSTISRDLRKLGAVRGVDDEGQTVYRLPADAPVPVATRSLGDMIVSIETNGAIIVIRTLAGSASLIALHLDQEKPEGILGTIAGDDTIFVAPASVQSSKAVMRAIRESFDGL